MSKTVEQPAGRTAADAEEKPRRRPAPLTSAASSADQSLMAPA
jgi:hypothetical protein